MKVFRDREEWQIRQGTICSVPGSDPLTESGPALGRRSKSAGGESDEFAEMRRGRNWLQKIFPARAVSFLKGAASNFEQKLHPRSEQTCNEHLQLERLISEFFASFPNLPPERSGEAVVKVLERVRAIAGFDACLLFHYDLGAQTMAVTHYAGSKVLTERDPDIEAAELPWFSEEMQRGRRIAMRDVWRDLPKEAKVERRWVLQNQVKSVLALPIKLGPNFVEGIVYQTALQTKEWSEPVVEHLRLIGEILISALTGKRAEAELRQSEERFSKAFFSSPCAISISRKADGRIIDVNASWQKLFKCERVEAVKRTFAELDIFVDEERRCEPEGLARATVSGQSRDLSVRTKAGEVRMASVSVETITVGSEECFITLVLDITERTRAEEATQNLLHAARLALIGELTASIAHEINQPLGAILSNTDAAELLLEEDNPRLDEVGKILADIRRDNLRASNVIRQIRALLRRRPPEMQPLDVSEVATSVLRLVEPDARRREVKIGLEFAASRRSVLGNAVHLQQVLLNLIVNGMEAMADSPAEQRRLVVGTAGDREVEIYVRDSGHGVPERELPRLFESFFTTKEQGMGLGLAIARSIVDAHGGRISAENNPEGGATFHVRLPGYRE